ncbi:MAG: UDP-4-amino-4,6-dideoxy-N-acetyl-beta-L-altrosamine transaminase [Alteromonadaceae bacterium]|jgi:UDP-4-amino-4,6-dideoxy-N-acetyl-beta-L-altrosamine transaminase
MTSPFIPYGKQSINQADIDAVVSVLTSDFLTQGPQVPLFEQAISNYCNVNHGIATNSATSALHIACLALGVEKGDWVWTSPISFVASANCALYCGASIDFVDVSSSTGLISIESLKHKLEKAKEEGNLPKVIIPVHLCGHICNMIALKELAQEYSFKIVEDASHAIGAQYQQQPVGNCMYSDITVFSFHPVKIITAGEGGMAMCNDEILANEMRLYRSHGITKNPEYMQNSSAPDWYYEQITLGFNYRMTDIHAALGLSQLNNIDSFIKKRHQLVTRYHEKLTDIDGISLVTPTYQCYSAYHLFSVLLTDEEQRMRVFTSMREKNIGVNVHYIPITSQPYFQQLGINSNEFPNANNFYQRVLTLPLHPTLSIDHQDFVIKALLDSL